MQPASAIEIQPAISLLEKTPQLLAVINVLLVRDEAPWVRATYMDKLRRHMGNGYSLYEYSADELAALVRILKQLPEGPEIVTEHRDELKSLLSDRALPAAEREDLKALLESAESATPRKH